METRIFTLSLIGILLSAPVFASQYDNLIVFGDSLSDAASLSSEPTLTKEQQIGNNYWVKVEGKTGAPITSKDESTQLRALWPNYLMAYENLIGPNPNNTRYIYPSSQAERLGYSSARYSINYAWASAETGDVYVNDLLAAQSGMKYLYNSACDATGPGLIGVNNACVPGVIKQVKQYLSNVNNHPHPKTIFILWAGGNDIFNNTYKIAEQNKETSKPVLLFKMLAAAFPIADSMLSNPVVNLASAVHLLIQAGVPAQHIYVIGLPDLADIPAAIHLAQGNKVVLYTFSAISHIFNIMLRLDLSFNYLHAPYNLPNGHILSSQSLMNQLAQAGQREGLTHLTQDCIQEGAAPYCSGYVFFNDKHPSTATYKYMARYLASVLGT